MGHSLLKAGRARLGAAMILTLLSIPVGAQAPLFASEAPLSAVLTLPLSEIYREARRDKQLYMAGQIAYRDADGATIRLPVRSRSRGVFRRNNCARPPLRLNFKKSDVPGSVFEGQDKLKLVNPCTAGSQDQKYLLLEYLAYKVYEVISDHAFATRLMELSYQDSSQRIKPWQTLAFVIEDEGELIKRLGGEELGDRGVSRRTVDRDAAARVELFQYLIGNTDFSLYASAPERDCCHNIKHSDQGEAGAPRYIPIPYDFDSAGLVNAPYAEPPASLPISSVRKRFYMGYCRDPKHLDAAIAHFVERKAAITAVFSSELLDEKTRKKTLKYVEDFFETIEDPKKAKRSLYKRCRGTIAA